MSKRIVISCWGSHGDLFPYIGLAVALKRRGHTPVVATNAGYRALVEREDIAFAEAGPLIDASLGLTAEESVSVKLPANDDAIDDPYVVFVHGYQTAGGALATAIQFDWQAVDDLGNLTVSGPASAAIGETGTVDLQWAALPTGPGEKQVGAVSHSDGSGVVDVTSVNIANDEGAGFCDLLAC